MSDTTKQTVVSLANDIVELKNELGKLAEAHNTLVAAMNRMATALGNLGNDIMTGLNQQSTGVRALIATTSEILVYGSVTSSKEWEETLERNYAKAVADTQKELAEATIREAEETLHEEPAPVSSIIIP